MASGRVVAGLRPIYCLKGSRPIYPSCGRCNSAAASALRTYRRWRCQGNPTPAAVRLLAILAGFVPWVGWEDWEVHRGYLFPPGFSRQGLTPADFHTLAFWRLLVTAYAQDNAMLRRRVSPRWERVRTDGRAAVNLDEVSQ